MAAVWDCRNNRDTKRCADGSQPAVLVLPMNMLKARRQPSQPAVEARAAYSLQVEDPRSNATTVETFVSMPAVIERAAELIRAGYNVGIWSPVSVERH